MKLAFANQSVESRRDMILHNSISKTLMLLAMPSLMMGLVQSMMPLSDGLFINNVAGPYVASAVTYCQPILNMVVALSQGLGAAGMAVIGQLNGQGNFEKGRRVSSQLILLAFAMGILVIPVMAILAFPISAIVTSEISDIVWLYLTLNAFALPFYFMEAVYNAVKNANGKPEATFFRMLLLLFLKILFNYLFIYQLLWGIVGCVLSSFLSNVIVCLIMFYELFCSKSPEKLDWPGLKLDREVTADLLRIGLPTMLSNVMLNLGFYLINNEVQKYGAIVLNGQGIASNITTICFAMTGAFGPTVTTMVSMNIGAGQKERAKKAMWAACGFSTLTAAVLISMIVPFIGPLTRLFTRNPQVLEVASSSLHIYIYSVIGFGICMVQQGAFIGLGKTRVPLIISILRVWFLRYLFILVTEPYLGVFSVFWGHLFSNLMAAVIITLIILRTQWVSVLSAQTHPAPEKTE
ncbi:MATE family efflux transporter [Clostridium minihomine]|uniref:MATE family efflux transporter n=1 Tax=Clostridium minihomine TaxID=2045012 RepID=UPI000C78EBF6|nr:MATE family efflux transporter [Clostridium minihomine]